MSDRRIYTYVPLAIPGERSATLELSESLAQERDYLITRLRRELSTAAVMIVACGIVAWFVGARIVGRPIRSLVEKARHIAAGDFSGSLVLHQSGELSQLAGEMNLMRKRSTPRPIGSSQSRRRGSPRWSSSTMPSA